MTHNRKLFLGLVFFTGSHTLKTLVTLPNDFDVVMLECPSEQSEQIAQDLREFARNWRGSFKHVKYSRNIIASVYRKYLCENPSVLEQYDYILTSDMDVEFPRDVPWNSVFEMFRSIPHVGVVSFLCSKVNHVNNNNGWLSILHGKTSRAENGLVYANPKNNNNTGWQCIVFSSQVAKQFFVESSCMVVDSHLGRWLHKNKLCWHVLVDYPVRHLNWDAHNDTKNQPEDVQKYVAWRRAERHRKGAKFWHSSTDDCTVLFEVNLSQLNTETERVLAKE